LKLRYVIIGLGLLIVVVYGVIAVMVVRLSPGRGVGQPGFTAKEAYPSALQAAQAWQGDVQLVSANASWRDLGPEELLGEEAAWAFTFFSPLARQIRIISVTPDGAEAVDSIDVTPNTRSIDVALWQVDSDQVLNLFLDHGGRDFLSQNPDVTVSLRLGPGQGGEPIVWLAFGISGANSSTHTVQVDPTSGEVKSAAR
jgi:hypothetical protein